MGAWGGCSCVLMFLFINACVIFRMNNYKPTFAPPVYHDGRNGTVTSVCLILGKGWVVFDSFSDDTFSTHSLPSVTGSKWSPVENKTTGDYGCQRRRQGRRCHLGCRSTEDREGLGLAHSDLSPLVPVTGNRPNLLFLIIFTIQVGLGCILQLCFT